MADNAFAVRKGISVGNTILVSNGSNVGIGTTTPAYTLAVNGSFQATGNLIFSSTTSLLANSSVGAAGQVLTSNGTSIYWSTTGASVTGTDSQVQYNDNGALAAANGMLWTKGSNNLTIANTITTTVGGVNPNSNTAGMNLGTATARWIVNGNTANFSSSITTLAQLAAGGATYNGVAVAAISNNNFAVSGISTYSYGVFGQTSNLSFAGVYGGNGTVFGLLGANTFAVYGQGNGHVTGNFTVGGTFSPTSNTVGTTLGNTTARWILTANSITTANGVYPDSNTLGTALGSAAQRWIITANSLTLTTSLALASGGTGGTDAATARTGIGLTTMADASGNSTIVQRTAAGYIVANYFNTTADIAADAASHFAIQTASDSYIRWQTPANARTSLALGTGDSPTFVGVVASGTTTVGFSATAATTNYAGNFQSSTNYGIRARGGSAFGGIIGFSTDEVSYGILGHVNAYSLYGNGILYTNGEGRFTGNVIAYYSDKRLKNNIVEIDNALERLRLVRGVFYHQNDLAKTYGYDDTEQQVGVIAQEIQKVLPHAVKRAPFDIETRNGVNFSKSGEDYMTVQYEKVVPLLIQGLKEMDKLVISLQQQVVELQNRIDR